VLQGVFGIPIEIGNKSIKTQKNQNIFQKCGRGIFGFCQIDRNLIILKNIVTFLKSVGVIVGAWQHL